MQVSHTDRVAIWELNRPQQENGIELATIETMESALTELESDSAPVNCLLITGQPAVFCTGLDAQLLETCFKQPVMFRGIIDRVNRAYDRLEALPLISIACVDGACRLGGFELALACDLIVASESATLSDGHLAYDAMPGGGETRRLPARLGYSGALHFILQQESLNGQEAWRRGLVDETVSSGTAVQRGKSLAANLAALHPSLVRGIKTSLRAAAPRAATRTETEQFQKAVIDRLASP